MKFCVYTRTFYESPYINFFIEHYLNLGFEKIFILKTDDLDIKINNKFSDFIEIKNVENDGDKTLSYNFDLIKKSGYDWVLLVDNDEFLFINSQFLNIEEYVNHILKINCNINSILFRWLMIHKFNNENISFKDLIRENKMFYHDVVKSMVKINDIKSVSSHFGKFFNNQEIYFEKLEKIKINLRFDSSSFSYLDSCLLHVFTRSFNNLIIKSLITKFKGKIISNKDNFFKFINEKEFINLPDNKIVLFLKNNIGMKFILPFQDKNKKLLTNNLFFERFKLFEYESKFLDEEEEKNNLEILLKQNNINIENYYSLSERVIKIIDERKNFLL